MRKARTPWTAARTQEDRRDGARYVTLVEVEIATRDGVTIAAEISNVSATGFRMRSPMIVPRGAKVVARLRGVLRRQAMVVWQEGPFIGCRFSRPLTVEELERLLGTASG